ncbi:Hypothetical predicted protein [Podarcis lilfordi]|uniref:Uncharacterized protein n=1 Tax=Podarcis lilfordi TaxID=74358 RepID=A0AA35LEW8_9SAUR|nr:Hypothetical predicted protein [Podarcis lilfordi]
MVGPIPGEGGDLRFPPPPAGGGSCQGPSPDAPGSSMERRPHAPRRLPGQDSH